MSPVVDVLLLNACIVVALAAGVALVARFVKRPSVVHALWVVVLLKLMTPPLLEVATVPRPTVPAAIVPATTGAAAPVNLFAVEAGSFERNTPAARGADTSASSRRSIPWLTAIWISGALLLAGLVAFRAARFGRLARLTSAPPETLRREYETAARGVGLASPPDLRLVGGRVPPMVWGRPGRCEILLPEHLLDELESDERIALLAHELAHVRRRDHWVRVVELAAGILFWWHPVVWWVRRNLRLAEEQACDALVVEALPEKSKSYARGLVKTLEFLSRGSTPVSGLATGAGETRRIEERLTMIVKRDIPRSATASQRIAIAVLALGALVVFPTWSERAEAVPSEDQQQELSELRRQRLMLEKDLREVDLKVRDLELALDDERAGAEVDRRLAHAERLQLDGRAAEADELRREAEALRAEMLSRREMVEQELHGSTDLQRLELGLAEKHIELEEAERAGDTAAMDRLRDEVALIQEQFTAVSHEFQQQQHTLAAREYQRHLAMLELELGKQQQTSALDAYEAARLAAELEQIQAEAELHERSRVANEIERRMELLMQKRDNARAEGDDRVAAEIEKQLRELDRSARRQEMEILRGHAEDLEREIRRLKHELDQPGTTR
ncbi:MAG: M48 family metalloprotease [bacterium]|nr:M48 family metalloprotease [bacterium]